MAIMLAIVVNIENGIRKFEKSILDGFKDRRTHVRKDKHRIENRHRTRVN